MCSASVWLWASMLAFLPFRPTVVTVWAIVLYYLHAVAQNPRARKRAPMCTPAILLSIHWSTHTALSRLTRHPSGIAEEALPFVGLTIAAGVVMLLGSARDEEDGAEEARLHSTLSILGIGAFATHVAITLTAR